MLGGPGAGSVGEAAPLRRAAAAVVVSVGLALVLAAGLAHMRGALPAERRLRQAATGGWGGGDVSARERERHMHILEHMRRRGNSTDPPPPPPPPPEPPSTPPPPLDGPPVPFHCRVQGVPGEDGQIAHVNGNYTLPSPLTAGRTNPKVAQYLDSSSVYLELTQPEGDTSWLDTLASPVYTESHKKVVLFKWNQGDWAGKWVIAGPRAKGDRYCAEYGCYQGDLYKTRESNIDLTKSATDEGENMWQQGGGVPELPTDLTYMVTCSPCDEVASEWDGLKGVCQCKAGYEGSPDSRCTPCPPGQFKAEVTDTYPSGKRCLKCPPGTISHNPGSTTCTECGVGTYTVSGGGSECLACPHGKYKNKTGSGPCAFCGENADAPGEGNVGIDSCMCNAGYWGASGVKLCESNPQISQEDCMRIGCCTWNAGTSECRSAIGGFACYGCSACAPGTYKVDPGGDECVGCDYGKYNDAEGSSSGCIDCKAGLFQNVTGASLCWNCEAGKFAAKAGMNFCETCPGPRADPKSVSIYSLHDHTACADACPAGFHGTPELECMPCQTCVDNLESGERCYLTDDCSNYTKCWNYTSEPGAINISYCYPIKQILEEPGKQGLSTNTIAIIVIVVCAVVTCRIFDGRRQGKG